ncbi:MAG: hypothetical protein HYS74_02020 [Parcubacteria group bacterium]|nr:hypothetical protein [Parcubacteria group bacterium]
MRIVRLLAAIAAFSVAVLISASVAATDALAAQYPPLAIDVVVFAKNGKDGEEVRKVHLIARSEVVLRNGLVYCRYSWRDAEGAEKTPLLARLSGSIGSALGLIQTNAFVVSNLWLEKMFVCKPQKTEYPITLHSFSGRQLTLYWDEALTKPVKTITVTAY